MPFGRWDALADLLALHQQRERAAAEQGWTPPVDVHETPDRFVIMAEIPGLRRDDIRIEVRDGTVTISGTRPEACGVGEQYQRVERGRGSFSRSFLLPEPVDASRVSADLREGLLTVVVPKASDASPYRVQIR